jgi:UDP-N-acetylmuramate: L-alanyl-gamma-D-glutamyl-meso-diaminopimelate ligase
MPGKVPEGQRISERELVRAIAELGRDAQYVASVDDIVAQLSRELKDGDRVVVLSNGGFGGIHEKLLSSLAAARG